MNAHHLWSHLFTKTKPEGFDPNLKLRVHLFSIKTLDFKFYSTFYYSEQGRQKTVKSPFSSISEPAKVQLPVCRSGWRQQRPDESQTSNRSDSEPGPEAGNGSLTEPNWTGCRFYCRDNHLVRRQEFCPQRQIQSVDTEKTNTLRWRHHEINQLTQIKPEFNQTGTRKTRFSARSRTPSCSSPGKQQKQSLPALKNCL